MLGAERLQDLLKLMCTSFHLHNVAESCRRTRGSCKYAGRMGWYTPSYSRAGHVSAPSVDNDKMNALCFGAVHSGGSAVVPIFIAISSPTSFQQLRDFTVDSVPLSWPRTTASIVLSFTWHRTIFTTTITSALGLESGSNTTDSQGRIHALKSTSTIATCFKTPRALNRYIFSKAHY